MDLQPTRIDIGADAADDATSLKDSHALGQLAHGGARRRKCGYDIPLAPLLRFKSFLELSGP